MASDYLLESEGIDGESTDSKHPKAIELEPARGATLAAVQPGAAAEPARAESRWLSRTSGHHRVEFEDEQIEDRIAQLGGFLENAR